MKDPGNEVVQVSIELQIVSINLSGDFRTLEDRRHGGRTASGDCVTICSAGAESGTHALSGREGNIGRFVLRFFFSA